ncbi:GNAT family N-acetyltransferase [Oscillatoria sp. FACHB-1407]|uniref:GNAT family N-acetyltransferase n=1 Tax=Oscillatoria sp. FACHB-1407 TaxID=2692847 RepID=UPI0016825236|nr:GNAT family N-acetyltransferase [Oscillatoria sp. FACHB-1407]MBD2464149.1 GNAT family N-acetyltransferase [Oscillatoria sp. FACHB-1407]
MNLAYRTATSADLPLLNFLYAAMDDKPLLPNDQIAEIFAAIAQVPNYSIYLASLADEPHSHPIGTFSLLVTPTMMHRGFHRSAILDSVTVHPDYRNQGIGKAMMQKALQLSKEAGCYKVTLSSNVKRDRAHAFYESLGFKQHGWSFSYLLSNH